MISKTEINTIFVDVLKRLADNKYLGYNPYDLLASPRIYDNIRNNTARVVLTQLNKISPVNLRNIMGVRRKNGPKALALILSALIKNDFAKYKTEINYITNWLIENRSNKYDDYSIGFQFPIALSFYASEINSPSLIISLFVIYAFIEYSEKTDDELILEAILSFSDLIDSKLPKVDKKDILYYSYTFARFNEVYNATAKIGKFYALLYKLTKEEALLIKIDKILNYLQANQRNDGSWAYGKKIGYSDSFHTAFILDAIYEMNKDIDSSAYQEMFDIGLSDYMKSHVLKSGQVVYIHPKYPNKGLRKITEVTRTDIRDCAMAIVLLNKLNMSEYSVKILDWTLNNMYNPEKRYFYFYKEKFWTNKIEFLRPQAWMLYALSCTDK